MCLFDLTLLDIFNFFLIDVVRKYDFKYFLIITKLLRLNMCIDICFFVFFGNHDQLIKITEKKGFVSNLCFPKISFRDLTNAVSSKIVLYVFTKANKTLEKAKHCLNNTTIKFLQQPKLQIIF